MSRACKLTAMLLFAFAPLAFAQNADPAAPPAPPAVQPEVLEPPVAEPQAEPVLVLRELLVLQTDRYGDMANNPKLHPTTLFHPIKQRGRIKDVLPDGSYNPSPMPLGLITFSGTLNESMKLKLSLQDSRDRVHAHWPGNGLTGNQSIFWPDLAVADETDRVFPTKDKDDWLAPLRSGDDRIWLQSRQSKYKERFLLYDVSFKFKPAMELSFTDDRYTLSSRAPEQAAPPISVLLRKNDTGWTSDALAAPWPQPKLPIAGKAGPADTATPLRDALLPISDLLTQRGYNAYEIDLGLDMIAAAGVDQSSMSLVYILPVGVIDEHIKLQVKPTPDQITRTAIVVVNNVDPNLSSQVNALIDDLASEQWIKRDRAQHELINLGQAAIKKVQQLKNNKDPEVAFRARLILDAYDWKMEGGK